ncbi:hypothetical protein P7C70_g4407, partial [Phenoliferia sp. Uapishka_3]
MPDTSGDVTPTGERTPLLTPRSGLGRGEQPLRLSLSYANLALQSSFSITNESAFTFPGAFTPREAEDEDEEVATSESAIKESEPPLRSDLFVILGAMWVGSFLSALDGTVVATCLGIIGSEFNVSNSIGWLGTSYLLTQTAAQPLYGRTADIFGRKTVTLFSSSVFLVGSLACGLSQTYTQLLIARAFAGIGGAGSAVMAACLVTQLGGTPETPRISGNGADLFIMFCRRWAFLIQVPICALHTCMVLWKVENSFSANYEAVDIRAKIKRVDFAGSFLLVSAVGALLTGVSVGGNTHPWADPIVWGTLSAGVLLVVVFVLFETFGAKEPLISPHLLFTRTPGFVSLTNWFSSMAQFSMLYSVPLWFSAVKGASNSAAGAHLIPNVVGTSIASLAAGFLMSKTGRYRAMLAVSGGLTTLGALCMVFWSRNSTPDFAFWLSMLPGGLGYGGILTITLVALISAVPPDSMAQATGGSYLFRSTGSVLGISLSSAILQNALKHELPRVLYGPGSGETIKSIIVDIGFIQTLEPVIRDAVIGAYENAMRNVFVATTAMAFGAFLMCLGVDHHDLPSRLDRGLKRT